MYDEHDQRYHDNWKVIFHRLQERGRKLKELTERGARKPTKSSWSSKATTPGLSQTLSSSGRSTTQSVTPDDVPHRPPRVHHPRARRRQRRARLLSLL